MSACADAGRELGIRIIDANARRIFALEGADRAQFVAGMVGAIIGGGAGLVGAPAMAVLLEHLAAELRQQEGPATH